jgi:hypothetical protein
LIDPVKRSVYDQYGIEALMDDRSSAARRSPSTTSSSSANTSPSMNGHPAPSSFAAATASTSSSSTSPSFASPRSASSATRATTGGWAVPPSSSSPYYGRNAAAASHDDNDAETTHTFHFSFGSSGVPAMGMHTTQSTTIPTNVPTAAFTLPPLDIGNESNTHGSDSFGSIFGNSSSTRSNGHHNNNNNNNNGSYQTSYGTSSGTFTNYANLPAGQTSHMHMHLPQLTPAVAEKMLSSMLAAMGASPLPDLPTSSQSPGFGAFEALDTSYGNTNANSNGNDGMDEREDNGLPHSGSNDMITSYHGNDRKHWPAAATVSPAATAHWQSMMDAPMGRPPMSTGLGSNSRPSGPANVFPLELSLEDLFMGGVKRMRIQRLRWDAHGVLRPEIKLLEIKIMPGNAFHHCATVLACMHAIIASINHNSNYNCDCFMLVLIRLAWWYKDNI